MICRARSAAYLSAPEFHAGWPQQVCTGTLPSQPACSRSFTAAKPTLGRTRSTRQVMNSPTRGSALMGSVESPLQPVDHSAAGFFRLLLLGPVAGAFDQHLLEIWHITFHAFGQ